jgi:hypothetical protein
LPLGKIATLTRVAGGQKTVISWQDAPDDLFYRAGAKTKKVRKQRIMLPTVVMRMVMVIMVLVMAMVLVMMMVLTGTFLQTRKQLTVAAVRKAARKPFRRIL